MAKVKKENKKIIYNTRFRSKTILKTIELTLPPELLNIISEFHHCKDCLKQEKKVFCIMCDRDRDFDLYKICENCDEGKNRFNINSLSNLYNLSNYCTICNKKLFNILYCPQSTFIIQNQNFHNAFNCKICNIENRIMR